MTITIEVQVLNENNDFEFGNIEVVLNGQNKVALPSVAARWTRMSSFLALSGQVWLYRDTAITAGQPDDLSFVHNNIPLGFNQSQKAATTISASNYFLIDQVWAELIKKSATEGELFFKVRKKGGEFRVNPFRGFSNFYPLIDDYKWPYIIEPNSDIEMSATATTASEIHGGFKGVFADIY